MTRSNPLRAAGLVLAVSLLLPSLATGEESRLGGPAARSEPIVSPARLWDVFLELLAGRKPAVSSAEGDNGWLIDPDGDETPANPSPDTGWQCDPDG